MPRKPGPLYLFDVDGTLTGARKVIEPAMAQFMQKVRDKVTCGLVGGSDLPKIAEQMGSRADAMKYDYVFAENGLVAFKDGELIGKMSIESIIGEEKLQQLINFALKYMSGITLPAKRGNFVEFRSGLINFCPIGRSCTQQMREEFGQIDRKYLIREKFAKALREEFRDYGLTFAIGGQISIDAYPDGWDKRFCMRYVERDFKEIYFFGDKTAPGGNDHALFEDPRTIGYTVTSPQDTMAQVGHLLAID